MGRWVQQRGVRPELRQMTAAAWAGPGGQAWPGPGLVTWAWGPLGLQATHTLSRLLGQGGRLNPARIVAKGQATSPKGRLRATKI